MDDFQIKELVNNAIGLVLTNETHLILNDISEQCISHKLAEYLQPIFNEYNVDCEYNGNVDHENGRKKINVLKQALRDINLLRISEENLESEFIERAVFPDIIVHKRGTNKFNLVSIEVKKSTSRIPFDYDFLKLRHYTASDGLNYQLGIFILFHTGIANPNFEIRYYKLGEEVV